MGGSYACSECNYTADGDFLQGQFTLSAAPAGGEGELFSTYLSAKFANAKCTTCHAVANKNFVYNNHMSGGDDRRWSGLAATASDPEIEDYIGNVTNCVDCHTASAWAANWHAPDKSFFFTTGNNCTTSKGHISDAGAMRIHLNTDPLVLWAIGRMGVNQAEWNEHVNAWTSNSALPCN